jgi:hypothetical protein
LANITLEGSGRFRVNRKFSIFKKLGVGWKRTAPNTCLSSDRPAVSKLRAVNNKRKKIAILIKIWGLKITGFNYQRMKEKSNWIRIIYIIGIIALIFGILDPLEGSVVIAAGSSLISLATYLTKDRHWKIFLASCIMILIGVFFMFYFSSMGGFGGSSTLSWWWGIVIIPYPVGWLMSIILLIVRAIKNPKEKGSV